MITNGAGFVKEYVLTVSYPEVISEKRALLQDYTKRLASAFQWGHDHPDAYAALVTQKLGIPPVAALRFVKRSSALSVPLDDHVRNDVDALAALYADAQITPKKIDISGLMDLSFPVEGASSH